MYCTMYTVTYSLNFQKKQQFKLLYKELLSFYE